jgi:cell division protein FtsN
MVINNKVILSLCCVVLVALAGCSRQQSDWEKTRAANTTEAYESFLKKYPSGEFTAQAQARVKELYEEHDWQKARDVDTVEAYQAFLKQYPEGKWTEEARIRVENFSLAQAPSGSSAATPAPSNAPAPGIPLSGDTEAPAAAPPASAEPASPAAPAPPKKAAKAAVAPAPAAAPSGSYGIQLGAFKSGSAAATQRWAHLQKKYPKLLAGLSPKVSPKKTSDGTLYRLQTFGITEAHAHAICKTLKADSQACILVHAT